MVMKTLVIACAALTLALNVGGSGSVARAEPVEVGPDRPLWVVMVREAAARAAPDPASPGPPVKMFEFLRVLPPGPGARDKGAALTRDGYYRVGWSDDPGSAAGWVHKDDVLEWPHRQALRLRPPLDRGRLSLFKTADDLRRAYSGGRVGPVAVEPEGGSGPALLPVLARSDLALGGEAGTAYRVAGRAGAGADSEPSTGLDVVLVVVATPGAAPALAALRAGLPGVLARARSRAHSLPIRWGLVTYRDRTPGPDPAARAARLACDLVAGAEPDTFLRAVEAVRPEPAPAGAAGDALAGLTLAARATWRSGRARHLILIGGPAAHAGVDAPGEPTMPGLLGRLQPPNGPGGGVVGHAIRLRTGVGGGVAGVPPDSDGPGARLFDVLAAGRDRPGVRVDAEAGLGLVDRLEAVLGVCLDDARAVAAVLPPPPSRTGPVGRTPARRAGDRPRQQPRHRPGAVLRRGFRRPGRPGGRTDRGPLPSGPARPA